MQSLLKLIKDLKKVWKEKEKFIEAKAKLKKLMD